MGKLIVIDAGHGGHDPGACGNGLQEKDVNLKVAKKLGIMLSAAGLEVTFTRTDDVFVTLGNRAALANRKNADLFLSLHCNAAAAPNAAGIETLIYSDNSDSNRIAALIQAELIEVSGLINRGVKYRPDLAVLNSTKMTAALVELGFISNIEDARKLKDELFLNDCAGAISRAVCEYFGIIAGNPAEIPAQAVDHTGNVPEWQKDAFWTAVTAGRIKSPEYWEDRLGDHITIGEVFSIIANV